MKSFLPPNCLKGGMCLLHLKKATMHTVKQLLQPHLARRVQPTIKSSRTCPTLSQVPRSQRQSHVSQRLNLVYAIFLYLRLVLGNPWGLGNLFYPLNTHGEIEDFLFFA